MTACAVAAARVRGIALKRRVVVATYTCDPLGFNAVPMAVAGDLLWFTTNTGALYLRTHQPRKYKRAEGGGSGGRRFWEYGEFYRVCSLTRSVSRRTRQCRVQGRWRLSLLRTTSQLRDYCRGSGFLRADEPVDCCAAACGGRQRRRLGASASHCGLENASRRTICTRKPT